MAGTVVLTEYLDVSPIKKIKWAWTSTAGGAADKQTDREVFGEVIALHTIPAGGGSAPTDDYDITVTDPEGFDVLLGAGANRDTANAESAVPTSKTVAFGKLTLNVTNAGNAKGGTAILYVRGVP